MLVRLHKIILPCGHGYLKLFCLVIIRLFTLTFQLSLVIRSLYLVGILRLFTLTLQLNLVIRSLYLVGTTVCGGGL